MRPRHLSVFNYRPPDASPTPPSPGRDSGPLPGSSCYALRAAVANLSFWNDFQAEKIGSGFFADVYKITRRHSDCATPPVMAVKIIKSKDRVDQQNMLRELELMNRLSHPKIVRYLGACVKEARIHPLLEYISGGTLEEVLANCSIDISWKQRIQFALDIAEGMTYLHSEGVLHRDLNSRNCLIKMFDDGNMEAVVSDFGLARVGLGGDADVPRRMSVVGSPYWMAPEMLRGEEYTKKVDVFSYGILLCEIIARITADPDELPRTPRFGLDMSLFRPMCFGCPEPFLTLAEECCTLDPMCRPGFPEIVDRLEGMLHVLDRGGRLASGDIRRSSVAVIITLKLATEELKEALWENESTSDAIDVDIASYFHWNQFYIAWIICTLLFMYYLNFAYEPNMILYIIWYLFVNILSSKIFLFTSAIICFLIPSAKREDEFVATSSTVTSPEQDWGYFSSEDLSSVDSNSNSKTLDLQIKNSKPNYKSVDMQTTAKCRPANPVDVKITVTGCTEEHEPVTYDSVRKRLAMKQSKMLCNIVNDSIDEADETESTC
ncbi:dual specificity testis-specific protein kinase 1-like [Antedon mediterranea]|uniref:dual specificity testis-specific protein kinase 1-like n=1 Tax=Antedon mediterranea TaxID=105859 RepID=UPI003AF92EFF